MKKTRILLPLLIVALISISCKISEGSGTPTPTEWIMPPTTTPSPVPLVATQAVTRCVIASDGDGAGALNLRSTPNTDNSSNILTTLPNGTPLWVLEDQGEWLKVWAGRKEGFVQAKYTGACP